MDRTERFQRILTLLRQRKSVTRALFLEELEVSLATFKRDLEYLRDRLGAPITYDRERGGYRLDESAGRFDLPGAWFSAAEAHALLTVEHLLASLQPGLLDAFLDPLRERVAALLGRGDHSVDEVRRRIRVLHMQGRAVEPVHFQAIADALLARKRLRITHYSRFRNEETRREISPQRLVHYRDSWYLDSYCHLRDTLRSFAVDSLRQVEPLDRPSRDIEETELDAFFTRGYGIFAGEPVGQAVLRFTPERARWVIAEQWHPEQESQFDPEGYLVLSFPYSDERELVMDILRHGAEVEVLEPPDLRESVRQHLNRMDKIYAG